MIDILTGSIDIGELTLSPILSANEFKNSGLYDGGSLERIYALKGTRIISNRAFIISIYFANSYLKEIHLYISGDNYKDWSKSNELDNKRLQDEWLQSLFGEWPYRFSWGVISNNIKTFN